MIRRLLSIFAALIIVYLVLVHYTGFGKDVAAISTLTTSSAKVFQGR